MKKNNKPLPSMWDKVKSLQPISYQQKKWSIFEENERVRWGFAAHELQEHLTKELPMVRRTARKSSSLTLGW